MHELGIVFNVVEMVEDLAVENQVEKVTKIKLKIGRVSTVIPKYFEDCWKWVQKKNDIIKDTELVLDKIEAITYCEDCESDYSTVAHGKICPNCGSENTYLKQGNEFIIDEIEVI